MSTASRDRRWTLEELHALPDDRNKYELIDGELFVTPAPTDEHERILARLHAILVPYVFAEGLGQIYRPRSVFRIGRRVEVEPDLMVRQDNQDPDGAWERAPLPSLVVEALSKPCRSELALMISLVSAPCISWLASPSIGSSMGRPARSRCLSPIVSRWW